MYPLRWYVLSGGALPVFCGPAGELAALLLPLDGHPSQISELDCPSAAVGGDQKFVSRIHSVHYMFRVLVGGKGG